MRRNRSALCEVEDTSAVRCNAVQCSTMQYSPVQCSTVQYSAVAVEYSTARNNTVQ